MNSPLYIVLNDLCLYSKDNPISDTKYEARRWVKSFYELVIHAQNAGAIGGLRTYLSFDEIKLVKDYTLRDWSADEDIDRDLRLRMIEIFSQLSHSDKFPENQQGDPLIDCKFNHQRAYGIWGAIYLDSFSISLLTHSVWDTHELIAEIEELDEETLEVDERTEMVRHLTKNEHLLIHTDWLTNRTRIVIPNGTSLWSNHKRLFPSLSFCKNTKQQIKSLSGLHLRQVMKRLSELEEACKNWKDGAFDMNVLPHCTPESQATLTQYRSEHSFECDDSITRLFSLHTRFTPDAGRIFFYPHVRASGERVLFIGHVDRKLPNVSY